MISVTEIFSLTHLYFTETIESGVSPFLNTSSTEERDFCMLIVAHFQ
jgi:hypothetical protein